MSNLDLWKQVESTDPDSTKEYRGAGGFAGTSINSTYQVKKATKMFGPVGIGWGYTIVSERFDEGAAVPIESDGHKIVSENVRLAVHTLHLKLWYMMDGKKGEVEHFGHTPFVYINKWGIQIENEPAKKSLTDAIGKCLSMLGFSADIFSGEYDNQEYLDQLRVETEIAKSEDKEQSVIKHRNELSDYVMRHIETIKTSQSIPELNTITKTAVRYLTRRQSMNDMKDIAEKGVIAITRESETKKTELEGDKNETV